MAITQAELEAISDGIGRGVLSKVKEQLTRELGDLKAKVEELERRDAARKRHIDNLENKVKRLRDGHQETHR